MPPAVNGLFSSNLATQQGITAKPSAMQAPSQDGASSSFQDVLDKARAQPSSKQQDPSKTDAQNTRSGKKTQSADASDHAKSKKTKSTQGKAAARQDSDASGETSAAKSTDASQTTFVAQAGTDASAATTATDSKDAPTDAKQAKRADANTDAATTDQQIAAANAVAAPSLVNPAARPRAVDSTPAKGNADTPASAKTSATGKSNPDAGTAKKADGKQDKTAAPVNADANANGQVASTDGGDTSDATTASDDAANAPQVPAQANAAPAKANAKGKAAKGPKADAIGGPADPSTQQGIAPANPAAQPQSQVNSGANRTSGQSDGTTQAVASTTSSKDDSDPVDSSVAPPTNPQDFANTLSAAQQQHAVAAAAPHAASLQPGAAQGSAATSGNAQAQTVSPDVRFAEANHSQLVSGIHGQLLPTGGSMQIRLDPPELGAVNVIVRIHKGVMNANFETSNDQATRMLSHSLTQLKTALESQGVSVGKLHVQQTPRNQQTPSQNGQGRDGRSAQDDATSDHPAQQEQQRREMLRRMWQRLSGTSDPLDMVA